MTKRKLAREHPPLDHAGAMALITGAAGVTLISFEEAVAIYLRARHILVDDAEVMGEPVPVGWMPPCATGAGLGTVARDMHDAIAKAWGVVLARAVGSDNFREVSVRFPTEERARRFLALCDAARRAGDVRADPSASEAHDALEWAGVAIGEALDQVGARHGLPRRVETDDDYRARILRRARNEPEPKPSDVGRVLVQVLARRTGSKIVRASDEHPRAVQIDLRDPVDADGFLKLVQSIPNQRESD